MILEGFSGCRVDLTASGTVRKTAPGPAYNDRLRAQCLCQKQFFGVIECPAVLSEGMDGDRYFFEMAFVPGMTPLDAADAHGTGVLVRLADRLAAMLVKFADDADGVIAPDLFRAKIAEVGGRIGAAFEGGDRAVIETAVSRLAAADWNLIPKTSAHGDLTLENILARPDGGFTFIDFLDGPFRSAALDLAKLRQDTRAFWCLRPRPNRPPGVPVDRIVLLGQLDRLLDERLSGRLAMAADRQKQLLAFQLLRIVPYCVDRAVARFLAFNMARQFS